MAKQDDILPDTTERVAVSTADRVNRRIRRQIEEGLAYYAEHPDEIRHRLAELKREWDIERVLEANAASLALTGVALGTRDRRFLVLPALVTGFLLQHALQGWCPPIPILRSCGVRTAAEIDLERNALKVLRGDYRAGAAEGSARDRALRAIAAAEA